MGKQVNISGEITADSLEGIKAQLDAARGGDIDIHIASPGGACTAGFRSSSDKRL
jgi:ATP-dependent protease ClpP protease subunit